jgi:hypothetical protein
MNNTASCHDGYYYSLFSLTFMPLSSFNWFKYDQVHASVMLIVNWDNKVTSSSKLNSSITTFCNRLFRLFRNNRNRLF